jgi:hypothetical protein
VASPTPRPAPPPRASAFDVWFSSVWVGDVEDEDEGELDEVQKAAMEEYHGSQATKERGRFEKQKRKQAAREQKQAEAEQQLVKKQKLEEEEKSGKHLMRQVDVSEKVAKKKDNKIKKVKNKSLLSFDDDEDQ